MKKEEKMSLPGHDAALRVGASKEQLNDQKLSSETLGDELENNLVND